MKHSGHRSEDQQVSWIKITSLLDRTIQSLQNADVGLLVALEDECEGINSEEMRQLPTIHRHSVAQRHASLEKLILHTRTNLDVLHRLSAAHTIQAD